MSAQENTAATRPLASLLRHPSIEALAPSTIIRHGAALRRWERYAGVVTLADVTLDRARQFVSTRLATCKRSSVAADYHSLTALLGVEEVGGRFDSMLLRELRRLGREELYQQRGVRDLEPTPAAAELEPAPVIEPGVPRPLASVLLDPSFRSRLSSVTIYNYKVAVRRWERYAGVTTTADVTLERARRFVDVRLLTVKAVSVRTDFYALLSVCDAEETAGRFDAELLHRLRRLVPEVPRRKSLCASFLTHEQVEQAVAAAPFGRAALAIRLLSLTGLRSSELGRLDWRDVDLERRVLHVRKGKTGARKVSLCAPAVEVLRHALALKADRPAEGQVVVGAERRNMQYWMEFTSERVGFKVTACLLRHTRASWWVAAGVPIAVVAKQLGHSIFVASRYYVGLSDDYNELVERGATGT